MKAIRTVLACIRKADNTYNLINDGDKIVVGLSGGKDSIVLIYGLYLYQKFSHTNFIIQPVTLDLGFPNFNPEPLEEFVSKLGLKLIVHDSKEVYQILKIQQKEEKHLPCSICSRMKKAAINKVANELGYNKVAFAHHGDDAIETFLMNEIYGGRIATFAPKMHLEKANITFIRPLILAREKEIIKLVKEEKLPVISSACPADKLTTREEIKTLLSDIYRKYDQAEENFLSMLSNDEHLDIWVNKKQLLVSNEPLYLKEVSSKTDALIMFDIRKKVFIDEQSVSYEDEMLIAEEDKAKSYLIYLKNTPIGTIRYRYIDNLYIIGRFAILKEYRGKGYGRKVMEYLVDLIYKKYNPCTISLNAQTHVEHFYASLGFISEGKVFLEAGLPHIKMKKKC